MKRGKDMQITDLVELLEAMSSEEQDELATQLINKYPSVGAALATKINIAHQDRFYTESKAMNDSLEARGHVGFDQGRKLVAKELGIS
jgi:hypothetical protein